MQTPAYGRFVILIDGNNLYHTLRELQFHVDYRQLLAYFRTCGTLIRAHYFTALLDAPLTPDWLVRLIDWLSYNGFKVHTKRAKLFERRVINEFGEESYIQEVKSSVEMEMTIEALQARAYCDTIVIFSGSGDLSATVKAIQRTGCRVVIVSSNQTQNSTPATDLLRQADDFVDLVQLRPAIEMQLRP